MSVAERLGITYQRMHQLEKVDRNIRLDTLDRVAEVLEVKVEWLIGGSQRK